MGLQICLEFSQRRCHVNQLLSLDAGELAIQLANDLAFNQIMIGISCGLWIYNRVYLLLGRAWEREALLPFAILTFLILNPDVLGLIWGETEPESIEVRFA